MSFAFGGRPNYRLALTPLALAAALTALSAQAQQAAPKPDDPADDGSIRQLDRVTITTGSRAPKTVDKIPGAVNVIAREDVQQTLAVTEDASAVLARTVPGYAESSQAMSNTGENLRGRVALRLFDGVPQGSPLREGTRNATFTDMGLIGRIEVINGPSASEGIGAAGGIINYISRNATKRGDEFELVTRFTTQGKDDSSGWKVAGNYLHKDDTWDSVVALSRIERGMTYDGHGRRIGLNTSGSVADSVADNLFAKVGFNFGDQSDQRLQASISSFKITGNGNYHLVDGDRNTGVTNTSEKPGLFGTLSEINDFQQFVVNYRHDNFLAGTLTVDGYYANQHMRYPAENGDDRQDPLIAPLGTLVDQSEIRSKKHGLRLGYAAQDAFGLKGFEFRTGVDFTHDKADQRLALTDRLWVPPMNYDATEPWVQLAYDIGDLTISGGYRHESGKLKVDSYTTTYYRNRVAVQGGELSYTSNLPNIGLVYKLPAGWSVFASTGKGFTLPNVGIPLRNINKPGQSVDGILDLKAIVVKNEEVGFNWRSAEAAFSGSYYHSKSDFGQSLAIDPVTNDFLLTRAPVDIKGYEFSAEYRPSRDVRLTALYSHTAGKTWFTSGGPLDKQMGVNDINPNKLGGSASWKFTPQAEVSLDATKLFSRDLNVGAPSGEEHTRGYTLWNMTGSYDWGRPGKTTVGIENLFDKFYILSWSQVAGFRNYWSGRGRVVSVTHAINF